MDKVMYALGSKIGSSSFTYGLYHIGKKKKLKKKTLSKESLLKKICYYIFKYDLSKKYMTVLTAVEASTPEELGDRIFKEYNEIIDKTKTEIITFKKFSNMKIGNVVEYFEMEEKDKETVVKKIYEAKDKIIGGKVEIII